MRRLLAGITATLIASAMLSTAPLSTAPEAKPVAKSHTAAQTNCSIEWDVCSNQGCLGVGGGKATKNPLSGDLLKNCQAGCQKQFNKCSKKAGTKTKTEPGAANPRRPKTGDHAPPRGGVTDLQSPPKGTGSRAPFAGGVKSTPSSGGGGPILRSTGGKK